MGSTKEYHHGGQGNLERGDKEDIGCCVNYPKLCAWFNIVCMHARMCTPTDIINPPGIPMWTYAEDFMTILLKLVDIWYFFPLSCVHGFTYRACMHACGHPRTLLINMGYLYEHMLKISLRSYKNWLIYGILFIVLRCVHYFTYCACMHACAHPQALLINLGYQCEHMLKISWRSY